MRWDGGWWDGPRRFNLSEVDILFRVEDDLVQLWEERYFCSWEERSICVRPFACESSIIRSRFGLE